MPINRLHHIGMSVPDLDKAVAFYVGVLGFQRSNPAGFDRIAEVDRIIGLKDATARVEFLRRGALWIGMFEFSAPAQPAHQDMEPVNRYGISHFCLDVSDVDTVVAECRAKGMRFHNDPISIAGVRTAYGRDPFGNVIELQEILDADAATPQWRETETTA